MTITSAARTYPQPSLDLRELEKFEQLCFQLLGGVVTGSAEHIEVAREVLRELDAWTAFLENRLTQRVRVHSEAYSLVVAIAGAGGLCDAMSFVLDDPQLTPISKLANVA